MTLVQFVIGLVRSICLLRKLEFQSGGVIVPIGYHELVALVAGFGVQIVVQIGVLYRLCVCQLECDAVVAQSLGNVDE